MLETFHWFQGEAFELITEDLAGMPRRPRVVAEGFRLLPQLVAPLLGDRARALWRTCSSATRCSPTVSGARSTPWAFTRWT